MKEQFKEQVKSFPKVPGVYQFKNAKNKIIYIGKAVNIKARVGSYFNINLDPRSKTFALVKEIFDISYTETQSELEAIVLEAALIKKYKPKYNIALKDNKSFLYIVIRPEKVTVAGKKRVLGRILAARKQDLLKSDLTFGPFPNSRATRSVVRIIRRVFPYRDCSQAKFSRYEKLERPCLYGHINLCTAPCVGFTESDLKRYRGNIQKIKKFLRGETSLILRSIEKQMKTASKNKDYELAAQYRDLLEKFNYVRQKFHVPKEYMDNPYLVYDLAEQSQDALVLALPILNAKPERVECYDISTLSGKNAVGSMVVAHNGRIDTSEYRRFKIKRKSSPDDFGMMKEVLERRLKRELSSSKSGSASKWGTPNLLVVDGGKGQVSAALDVVNAYSLNIPVIGLAKKLETVVYFNGEEYIELDLPKDNSGLQLLIKLRDESHRFAQDYHHKLRKKSFTE